MSKGNFRDSALIAPTQLYSLSVLSSGASDPEIPLHSDPKPLFRASDAVATNASHLKRKRSSSSGCLGLDLKNRHEMTEVRPEVLSYNAMEQSNQKNNLPVARGIQPIAGLQDIQISPEEYQGADSALTRETRRRPLKGQHLTTFCDSSADEHSRSPIVSQSTAPVNVCEDGSSTSYSDIDFGFDLDPAEKHSQTSSRALQEESAQPDAYTTTYKAKVEKWSRDTEVDVTIADNALERRSDYVSSDRWHLNSHVHSQNQDIPPHSSYTTDSFKTTRPRQSICDDAAVHDGSDCSSDYGSVDAGEAEALFRAHRYDQPISHKKSDAEEGSQSHAIFAPQSESEGKLKPDSSSKCNPPIESTSMIEASSGIRLCQEQVDLVDLVMKGHNVFFTGQAGCGKSTVLKAFVQRLRQSGKRVDIIAPTGIAALNVQGSTLHLYAGWSTRSTHQSIDKIQKDSHRRRVWQRLTCTDALVIDEISMVENLNLERLSYILKESRDDDRPFGGVQIIVTGDFCQLPPVKPFSSCFECGLETEYDQYEHEFWCPDEEKCGSRYLEKHKWAFESFAWREAGFVSRYLSSNHRQADLDFKRILATMRAGDFLSEIDEQLLTTPKSQMEHAVHLLPSLMEVQETNEAAFSRLQGSEVHCRCSDASYISSEDEGSGLGERLIEDSTLLALQDHRFQALLRMKEGMPVILLANLNPGAGLANGSQGTIVGFEKREVKLKYPQYCELKPRDIEEEENMYRKDLLRYEAITRCVKQRKEQSWPIVRFSKGIEKIVIPECSTTELGATKPYSIIGRAQIPLVAGWAMSIHKSQGLTFSNLTVDLDRCFARGQAYVALSRARSIDGLLVLSLGNKYQGPESNVKRFLDRTFGGVWRGQR